MGNLIVEGKKKRGGNVAGVNNNLIPLNQRDPEEVKAIQSKGAYASHIARKRNTLLKHDLIKLLQMGDTQEKVSMALIGEALNGNVKAFEVLRDTIGEKPVDRSESKIEFNDGKLDDILKAMK